MNMNNQYDYMIGRTLTESTAGSRAYRLPTMHLMHSINKCLEGLPSADWWVINGSIRSKVYLRTSEVQACVFNAVNDLSIKLMN
jgi:hypothetical protein